MAALLIVLFLITFVFDTRIGLAFLAAAVVVLYRGGAGKKLRVVRGEEAPASQKAWKDPWGTEHLQ